MYAVSYLIGVSIGFKSLSANDLDAAEAALHKLHPQKFPDPNEERKKYPYAYFRWNTTPPKQARPQWTAPLGGQTHPPRLLSDVWYELTGEIISIAKQDYGNFTIKDATGEIYIYGMTSKWVGSNDKSFSQIGLKVGDTVTLGTRQRFGASLSFVQNFDLLSEAKL